MWLLVKDPEPPAWRAPWQGREAAVRGSLRLSAASASSTSASQRRHQKAVAAHPCPLDFKWSQCPEEKQARIHFRAAF